jgi:hypothetical protein
MDEARELWSNVGPEALAAQEDESPTPEPESDFVSVQEFEPVEVTGSALATAAPTLPSVSLLLNQINVLAAENSLLRELAASAVLQSQEFAQLTARVDALKPKRKRWWRFFR